MPRLYQRKELPALFEAAGLPAMTLSTLHKLHSYGLGPLPASYAGRVALYDGDEALEWRRARLAAQTSKACDRAEQVIRWRLKQVERLQRLKKAAGCSK